jgi:hypothetical protein
MLGNNMTSRLINIPRLGKVGDELSKFQGENRYVNQRYTNLQTNDFEATAKRRCVTLANLWERQPGGPTCI